MAGEKNALPPEQLVRRIELLNRRLADAINLQLQSRQAYWNVKGPNFMSLRTLFDKITGGVEEAANMIAEHIVQLGGTAEGTAHAVVNRTSLDGYTLTTGDGNRHIAALATTLTNFGRHMRYASEQAAELQDADTAALFTEIARNMDTWLWFVQTSQQTGS